MICNAPEIVFQQSPGGLIPSSANRGARVNSSCAASWLDAHATSSPLRFSLTVYTEVYAQLAFRGGRRMVLCNGSRWGPGHLCPGRCPGWAPHMGRTWAKVPRCAPCAVAPHEVPTSRT